MVQMAMWTMPGQLLDGHLMAHFRLAGMVNGGRNMTTGDIVM
jgi:hypothetical protein